MKYPEMPVAKETLLFFSHERMEEQLKKRCEIKLAKRLCTKATDDEETEEETELDSELDESFMSCRLK